VLDLGLPDMDGTEVIPCCGMDQNPHHRTFCQRRGGDKIAALDAGADDYLTKPSAPETAGAARAALRRINQIDGEPVLTAGELSVDLSKRQVTLSGEEVQLTPTEYDLLRLLVTHADRVITQRQLLSEVWGHGYEQEYHILHVNVSNLRRKIEQTRRALNSSLPNRE